MAHKSETNKTLTENIEQYHQLVEHSPVAIGILQNDKIAFINTSGAKLLGNSSPEQLTGKSLLDFAHPDYRKIMVNQLGNILKGKNENETFELKFIGTDGSDIDIEITASRFTHNNKPAVQFTFSEISRRKKMEELILQSRHDWEDTFHAITDVITIHDKDFNIIYANKAAQTMLKLPALDNHFVHKCFKFYHGTKQPPEGCPSCDCLKTGKPANFEIFEPHLNTYVEIRSMPRLNSNNELIGLIHIARDVTERKEAEEEIQKAKDELELRVEERTSELRITNKQLMEEINERKIAVEALQKSEIEYRELSNEFNTLLNGIPDNLILLSPDLKIMWANKAAARVFGKDISNLKGHFCYGICCSIFSPCDNCPTSKSFLSGKEENAEIQTSDGKVWDIRAFPIKDESGTVKSVIELAGDITEKVNLRARAMRTKHLASLGELAAGVAHEINNPINNIINYAQLLIDEAKESNRDDEISPRIIKDGERIAAIVRSLLSFARFRKEEKVNISLHDILSDTLSLTSAQIRKDGIELKIILPDEPINISTHPQLIQQVFLNIISNARYALNQRYPESDDNKILEIECKRTEANNKPFVEILFHDHGTGIPKDILDKILNPFFSTKPAHIGTGLGLSISHGIISEHGGNIMVESIEGDYTNILIYLPEALAENECKNIDN
ncbi:MAG: PAS domain-containing protein [Nitrospira sp.]|nr:PAS domain-containing protein [Nitrospira sp.]